MTTTKRHSRSRLPRAARLITIASAVASALAALLAAGAAQAQTYVVQDGPVLWSSITDGSIGVTRPIAIGQSFSTGSFAGWLVADQDMTLSATLSLANSSSRLDINAGVLARTGTIDNSGFDFSGGTINNNGTLEVSHADFLDFGHMNNAGTMRLIGARMDEHNLFDNSGSLSVDAASDFTIYSTFNNTGLFDNAGLLQMVGGNANLSGTVNNHAGARLLIGATGTVRGALNNLAGGQLTVGGTTSIFSGGTLTNDGVFTVTGSLINSGAVANHAGATIAMQSGGILSNGDGGSFTNAGALQITGATYTQTSLTGANSGSIGIAASGATHGSFNLSNGARFSSTGIIANADRVNIAAGAILDGGGSYAQSAGMTTVDGRLTQAHLAFTGGLLNGRASFSGGTRVADTGVIGGDTTIGGSAVLAPGENGQAGLLAFDALHFTGGTFSVLIGGTARGSGYSAIDAASADLAGTLAFSFLGGPGAFVPHLGDKFDLIETSGSISGDFSAFDIAGPAGLAWSHSIVSLAGGGEAYEFQVVAVPEPGTYALMLGGLLLLAGAGRRRGRQG